MIFLRDYVHLYVGCPVRIKNKVTGLWSSWRRLSFSDCVVIVGYDHVAEIALRPLRSMTDSEALECHKLEHPDDKNKTGGGQVRDYYSKDPFATPKVFHYLLSKHFDLFDLIKSGLAVDATTTNLR